MSIVQAQNSTGVQRRKARWYFWKKSKKKLEFFQKSRELTVTGELDAPTIDALR